MLLVLYTTFQYFMKSLFIPVQLERFHPLSARKKTQFKFKACKVIFNFYRSVFGANNLILLLMIQIEEV